MREYGIPDRMKLDGSKEQCKKHINFQGTLKKYDMQTMVNEPNRSDENPFEGVIRKLRKYGFVACLNQDVLEDFGTMAFLILPNLCNLLQVMHAIYKAVRQLTN